MGRGATGRLFTFELVPGVTVPGRVFEFRESARFTFARGTLALSIEFAFLFTFAGRLLLAFLLTFELLLALLLSFGFFGFGRLGLFSLADELVLRFSFAFS